MPEARSVLPDHPHALSRREGPAAAPALTPRTITVALLAILGLGLLVRLLHFRAITETAFPRLTVAFTGADMYAYWQWAQTILAGDWLGRDTFHPLPPPEIAPLEVWYRWWGGKEIFQQAPLYAYWVAGLLGVSGRSLAVVLLVQLLLGALQPLVMFGLARRLFDARVGLGAAGLRALPCNVNAVECRAEARTGDPK